MSEVVEVAETVMPVAVNVPASIQADAPTDPNNADGDEPPKPADQATAKTEPAPGEGKNRFQRRMDKVYRERAEAQARAEFFESRLKEAEAQRNAPKTDLGAPRLEDFSDIETYAKAYAEHEKTRAFKEIEDRQRQNQTVATRQRLVTEWSERVAAAPEEDFEEVVGDLQPTAAWSAAIMSSEIGDRIAYHLGKNLSEAQRIASLDPIAQIRAIGRLEATLSQAPPTPKPVSKAPAPISPVAGSGTGASNDLPDPKNFESWMKARNKQVHGSR